MRTLEQLGRLCHLEDLFAFFGLPCDPDVLEAHGSRILARFAGEVAQIEQRRPMPDEPERLALYGDALRRAHANFARSLGRACRPFRVIDGGRSGPLASESERER